MDDSTYTSRSVSVRVLPVGDTMVSQTFLLDLDSVLTNSL